MGPGGNAESLSVDLYDDWGRVGLLVERRVKDNDAYYALAQDGGLDSCCHDVSFSLGARAMKFAGAFDLEGSVTLTSELNRYFVYKNDAWNLNVGLSARWRPEG